MWDLRNIVIFMGVCCHTSNNKACSKAASPSEWALKTSELENCHLRELPSDWIFNVHALDWQVYYLLYAFYLLFRFSLSHCSFKMCLLPVFRCPFLHLFHVTLLQHCQKQACTEICSSSFHVFSSFLPWWHRLIKCTGAKWLSGKRCC